jgi:hypothetical protein
MNFCSMAGKKVGIQLFSNLYVNLLENGEAFPILLNLSFSTIVIVNFFNLHSTDFQIALQSRSKVCPRSQRTQRLVCPWARCMAKKKASNKIIKSILLGKMVQNNQKTVFLCYFFASLWQFRHPQMDPKK